MKAVEDGKAYSGAESIWENGSGRVGAVGKRYGRPATDRQKQK